MPPITQALSPHCHPETRRGPHTHLESCLSHVTDVAERRDVSGEAAVGSSGQMDLELQPNVRSTSPTRSWDAGQVPASVGATGAVAQSTRLILRAVPSGPQATASVVQGPEKSVSAFFKDTPSVNNKWAHGQMCLPCCTVPRGQPT